MEQNIENQSKQDQLIDIVKSLSDDTITNLLDIIEKHNFLKEKHKTSNLINNLSNIVEDYTLSDIIDISNGDYIGDLSNVDDDDIIHEVSNRHWSQHEINDMNLDINTDIDQFHDYEIIDQFKKIYGINNLIADMNFDKFMEETDLSNPNFIVK